MKITPTRVFIAICSVAVVWLVIRLLAVPTTLETSVSLLDPVELSDTDLRQSAREAGCGDGVALWLALLDRVPDDLEALRAVADCARRGTGGDFVDEASTLLGKSRFLRTLPAVLDELELKDRIPILKRVQTDPDLETSDLLDLGSLQRDLGDVKGALATLERAVSVDPENGTARLMLAHQQVANGEMSAARASFRNALSMDGVPPGMSLAYAATLAWPGGTGLLLLGFTGLFSVQAYRWPLPWARDNERGAKTVLIASVVFVLTALYAYFQLTGHPIAFMELAGLSAVMLGWTLVVPLRTPFAAGLRKAGALSGRVITGRIDQALDGVSLPTKLAVLFTGVTLLIGVVPALSDVDIAAGVLLLALVLIFSTVGSILLVLLRQSASMRSSLWWLGIAGTIPFLGFFLYLERRTLIRPLRGQPMDPDGIERVVGIVLLWIVGALLAAQLARILSRSILEPVQHVLHALQEVQKGNLEVDATLDRRDEIGQLGLAVNGMADGIREQQRLARTFRRYMDDRIASHLMEADVERGQLVDAVVMFSDLRGFTAMSEGLPPERLVDILNAYFGRIAPIVARHGGVVDKYMGDGMLAVWGVPESREVEGFEGWNDEALAVAASIAMMEAVRELNADFELGELRIGIGLHRGPLVAGPMGSPDHREYTVVGDTVNTAQRVESQARGVFQVLVSGAVAERIEPHFAVVAQEPVQVKGKADKLALFGVERSRV